MIWMGAVAAYWAAGVAPATTAANLFPTLLRTQGTYAIVPVIPGVRHCTVPKQLHGIK